MDKLFSSECISKYHPDKYCDQISDALLTEYLKQDTKSHCGIEVMAKDNSIVLGGEVTSRGTVDHVKIVNRVADKLHYKVKDVIDLIGKQSIEINKAVTSDEHIGAGDQGMMFGYAVANTESKLPYGFEVANKIIKLIEDEVVNKDYSVLLGDAKTQVTCDASVSNPSGLKTILLSVCHAPYVPLDSLKLYIKHLVADNIDIGKAKLLINPSGAWTIGGPTADCGLTGRKIVADQYGGYCAVGGGAFSGKDPSKVDRSASYMARKIAMDMLGQFELDECSIQLAYAIGIAEPVSICVGCNKPDLENQIATYVQKNYDLTPKGIIDALDLYHKDYEKIAEGCHYRPDSGLFV